MHQSYIEDMVNIASTGLNKAEMRIQFEKYWQDKVADVWTVDDLIELGLNKLVQFDYELSKYELIQILKEAFNDMGSDEGLGYEYLLRGVEYYLESKGELWI